MMHGLPASGRSAGYRPAQPMLSFNLSASKLFSTLSSLAPARIAQRCGSSVYQHAQQCLIVNSASSSSAVETDIPSELSAAKERLLSVVSSTQRGSEAGSLTRGEVEEAQVAVESCSAAEIDWDKLEGAWEVVYTTAPDVIPIVRPGLGLPGLPLRVGRVGQTFSSPSQGRVQNVIEVEALDLLFNGTKATFVVEATYEIRTAKSIALTFKSAGVESLDPGEGLRTLAAPALLPRGGWNMSLLMALEQLSFSIPLSTRPPTLTSSTRTPAGINYNITFLDEDLLIGRVQGSGGTFIFVRMQPVSSAVPGTI